MERTVAWAAHKSCSFGPIINVSAKLKISIKKLENKSEALQHLDVALEGVRNAMYVTSINQINDFMRLKCQDAAAAGGGNSHNRDSEWQINRKRWSTERFDLSKTVYSRLRNTDKDITQQKNRALRESEVDLVEGMQKSCFRVILGII